MPYNGPALDPYTRLLASLADAVGNARRSMHSMTLLMIAASILFVAATLLFATSIIWVPATFALATAWVVSTCWALFFRSAGAALNYVNGVCAKIKAEVASHIEADNGLHQRTREAVTDHSFLRNIFDALPGVDSDLAFQRLSMFQLGSPTTPERDKEAANIHGGIPNPGFWVQGLGLGVWGANIQVGIPNLGFKV